MTTQHSPSMTFVALCAACLVAAAPAHTQQQPAIQIPQPGVPQIMTLERKFVRVAHNNEGYVILGYQIANRTVGEEWIMLDVGLTVMERLPDYTLNRDAGAPDLPDRTPPPRP